MSFKIVPCSSLPGWVEGLLADHRVIGPQPLRDQFRFGEINAFDDLALDYTQTILPPKKAIFPQRDELLGFQLESGEVQETISAEPTVLLGVHTCDLHAIKLLDTVYSSDYADQHYLARREQTVIVSLECLQPCTEYAFCKSMGTLSVTEGYDLHLTALGDEEYAIDVGSEKGAALLESFEGVRDATDSDYRAVNQALSNKWPNFPYRLDCDISELANLLSISYESDLWQELGEKCLSCGSCTAVCPTCYCFNITDEVDFTLKAGKRYREWDHCTLPEFAIVAGGHNFRDQNAARQRHRFYRKGKYQMESYDMVGCVGCGRCAQTCLAKIDPVETYNELIQRRAPVGGQRSGEDA